MGAYPTAKNIVILKRHVFENIDSISFPLTIYFDLSDRLHIRANSFDPNGHRRKFEVGVSKLLPFELIALVHFRT